MIARLTVALFLAVLWAIPVISVAQVGLPWPGPGTAHSSGAAYTGPGDVVASASWWGGLRAYSSATRGTNAVRLCNGGVCADVISDASTGIVPNAPTINGAACDNSGHICKVDTLYGQIGGFDAVQATDANRPVWVVSCFTGLPCMGMTHATNQWLAKSATSATTLTQPYEIVLVTERTGDFSTELFGFGSSDDGGTNNALMGWLTLANDTECGAPTSIFGTSVADSVFHVLQFKANGASSDCNNDDTAHTGNAGAGSMTLRLAIGAQVYTGAASCTCRVVEAGIWPVGFTAGNVTAMNSNAKTFWGF